MQSRYCMNLLLETSSTSISIQQFDTMSKRRLFLAAVYQRRHISLRTTNNPGRSSFFRCMLNCISRSSSAVCLLASVFYRPAHRWPSSSNSLMPLLSAPASHTTTTDALVCSHLIRAVGYRLCVQLSPPHHSASWPIEKNHCCLVLIAFISQSRCSRFNALCHF